MKNLFFLMFLCSATLIIPSNLFGQVPVLDDNGCIYNYDNVKVICYKCWNNCGTPMCFDCTEACNTCVHIDDNQNGTYTASVYQTNGQLLAEFTIVNFTQNDTIVNGRPAVVVYMTSEQPNSNLNKTDKIRRKSRYLEIDGDKIYKH